MLNPGDARELRQPFQEPARAAAAPAAPEDAPPEDPPAEVATDAPAAAIVASPSPPPVISSSRQVAAQTYATAYVSAPRSADLRPPHSTGEVRDYIRRAALQRHLDPDVAVKVVLSEGGLNPATWVGDHGSSFGPFQLHYGGMAPGDNAVAGLGDTFTRDTGLRASDPATWRQQVDWSLDHAARSGWTPWHGAASAGITPHQGLQPRTRPAGLGAGRVVVPNQFAANLSAQDAYAACGPVAAVAVARWLGRNPTVAEALAQAKRTGWSIDGGMNGIANEKRLLEAMHVNARMEVPASWQHIQHDAANGNPVVLSTPNHYWVIDDYDPRSHRYHVGQSGLVYRGGAEWMSAADIERFGGGVNGALYVEHPLAPRRTGAVNGGGHGQQL